MNKLIFTVSMMLVTATTLQSCVTTNAEGVKQYTTEKTTISGERLRLYRAASVKRDCSVRILPEMKAIQAPKHGTIEIAHEKVESKFRGDYKQCTGKEVTGTVAYYTSQKGFTGHDKVIVRTSSEEGLVYDQIADINVVK